jgi:hypothetical protein
MDGILELGCRIASGPRRRLETSPSGINYPKAYYSGIPITTPDFWQNEDEFTEETLAYVFRSATDEDIPMFHERLACLREAGKVLYEVCVEERPHLSSGEIG